MSPLRHPIEEIHDRWGKAGLAIAVIALVATLGGTALAAKGAFTGTQKKEVEKIAKKSAGKPGVTGPAGPAGTNGTNGKDGTNGTNGKDGSNGENGKSVLVGTASPGECGLPGGTTVEVQGSGSKKAICNGHEGLQGEKGDKGEKGDPGPTTDVLLSGHTIRGLWGHSDDLKEQPTFQEEWIPVSFPLRVENAHGEGPTVHYIRKMPASGSFEWDTTVIGPAAGTGDLVEGQTEVTNVNPTSGEFATRRTHSFGAVPPPEDIEGQLVEGEGIPPETRIVAIDTGAHTLTLSNPATETKSGVALNGKPSRFLGTSGGSEQARPTVGDLVTGPGIPAGTTITALVHNDSGLHFTEVEISADPTATTGAAKITVSNPPGCTGNWEHPGAEPGNLCIFVEREVTVFAEEGNPAFYGFEANAVGGTIGFTVFALPAIFATETHFILKGTWAVTAE